MSGKLIWAIVAVSIMLGILMQGCGTQRVTTVSHLGLKDAEIDRFGVMPFFVGRHPSQIQQTMNCTLCRLSFNPESVTDGADSTLTRYVYEAMKTQYYERVIPQSEVVQNYAGIPKDEDKDTPLSLAQRLAETLNVNHMVLGTVWRYRERVGSSAGTSSPASVAFDLYLIDVPSGRLLWMASFDETQRSLSENVLDAKTFFRRGAKWLSANELARYGVGEVIREFPL